MIPARAAAATSTRSAASQKTRQRSALAQPKPRRGATAKPQVRELKAEVAARLRRAEEEDTYEDDLDAASNAVVHLVNAGKLDEAETAARDLLVRFPEVHDGWDRLGMVHEARGNSREAADCYRKVIKFIAEHPDNFDVGLADEFAKLVAKLDPPAAG